MIQTLKERGVLIRCSECGMLIKGNSEDNAKANLEIHKTSKHHKTQVKLKSSGAIILNKEGVKKK